MIRNQRIGIDEVHRLAPLMHMRAVRLPRISMQFVDLMKKEKCAMNRYAQVLTASALAYTAQARSAATWARGTTMSSPPQFIATAEQLVALTKEPRARHLVVCGNLANVPSFRLAPGQTLTGNGDNASISFVKGVDGLQLSSDNEVRNLRLEASAGR